MPVIIFLIAHIAWIITKLVWITRRLKITLRAKENLSKIVREEKPNAKKAAKTKPENLTTDLYFASDSLT
jgi:hypothetical protein